MAILRLTEKLSYSGNLPTGRAVSVTKGGEVETNDPIDIAHLRREGFNPVNAQGEAPSPSVAPLSLVKMNEEAQGPSAPGAPLGSHFTPLEEAPVEEEAPEAEVDEDFKDEKDDLICDICGKGPFKNRGGLQGHINIKHPKKKSKKKTKFDEI